MGDACSGMGMSGIAGTRMGKRLNVKIINGLRVEIGVG